jgi:hypothetical protein
LASSAIATGATAPLANRLAAANANAAPDNFPIVFRFPLSMSLFS